jgi:BNR repeat-like domain
MSHHHSFSKRTSVCIGAALAGAACAAAASEADAGLSGADRQTSRVTRASPFAADCGDVDDTGQNYPNAEVEPFASANPKNGLNMVGTWQQDRWSDGGSHGIGTGYSFNGGRTWSRVFLPFSRCAGGNAANGGDFDRASDPWVSFSRNGVVHQMALALGNTDPRKPSSAMLASRSLDGGRTWSATATLQADSSERFNDKNTITADPTDARYVYAVWDRLSTVAGEGAGPTLLARSSDTGATWEPTRIVFDPGPSAQTIGNRIEVLPSGRLVNQFALIDYSAGTTTVAVIVSDDKGSTWSAPIKVADLLSVGTVDPTTGAPVRSGAGLPQLSVGADGTVYSVWPDSRFSGGAIDGIALSQSTNGGKTWSEPVQVNREPSVAAFTPAVHVRRDGTVGVTYFDLRSDTSDRKTLPTDTWLAVSSDGSKWREARVAPAFDMLRAPVAGGLFVGDYQGLVSVGKTFVPFFVKTTEPSGTRNRTDAYSRMMMMRGVADEEAPDVSYTAPAATPQAVERVASAQARIWQAMRKAAADRLPSWFKRPAALSDAPNR